MLWLDNVGFSTVGGFGAPGAVPKNHVGCAPLCSAAGSRSARRKLEMQLITNQQVFVGPYGSLLNAMQHRSSASFEPIG